MNLLRSPSSWPHLVMEGDPQERKAQAYATSPLFTPMQRETPFRHPCQPCVLSGVPVLCSQNTHCPKMSNPSPRHLLKTLANAGSPCSLFLAGVSSICFSSPQFCTTGREVVFDYFLVCLYVVFYTLFQRSQTHHPLKKNKAPTCRQSHTQSTCTQEITHITHIK